MNDYSVSEQTCTLQAFPCSFEYFFLLKNLPDIWDQMPYHMWHIYLITNRIYKELYHILYRPYSIWVDQVLAWQSKVSFSHIGTPLDYLIFLCFSYLCYLLRILLAASLFLSSLFIPSLLSSYLSLIVIFTSSYHILLHYRATLDLCCISTLSQCSSSWTGFLSLILSSLTPLTTFMTFIYYKN